MKHGTWNLYVEQTMIQKRNIDKINVNICYGFCYFVLTNVYYCYLLLLCLSVCFQRWTNIQCGEWEFAEKCSPAQCPMSSIIINVQCSMYVYYESRLSDIQWLSVSVHVIRFSVFLFDLVHFSFEQFLCCLLIRSKMLFDCKSLLLFAEKYNIWKMMPMLKMSTSSMKPINSRYKLCIDAPHFAWQLR